MSRFPFPGDTDPLASRPIKFDTDVPLPIGCGVAAAGLRLYPANMGLLLKLRCEWLADSGVTGVCGKGVWLELPPLFM